MKPHSMDLRKRIVAAHDAGEGGATALAARFVVSLRSVQMLLARRRETGSIEPAPHGGGQPAKVAGETAEALRVAVEREPDATLEELRVMCGIEGSIMAVSRGLDRLGITRKTV